MLAGALLGAPAPAYRETETTMTGLFAGEHLTFTGALVREGAHDAVVRYAVTCCRADAAPVVVRLTRRVAYANGSWFAWTGRSCAPARSFASIPSASCAYPRRAIRLSTADAGLRENVAFARFQKFDRDAVGVFDEAIARVPLGDL